MDKIIEALREEREQVIAEMEKLVSAAREEERSLTEEEQARFDQLSADVDRIDERIAELQAKEQRAREAAEAVAKLESARATVKVGREPLTYERGRPDTSYIRDLTLAVLRQDAEAWDRLRRHAQEVKVEVDRLVRDGRLGPEYRDLSRADGAGGEFVPPLWLIEDYAAFARAARVTADLIPSAPLPARTDSINVPRVTGGTAVGTQSDNQAVTETDATTGSVSVPVNTIAGQQDVSLQAIEQSPVGLDEVILADLAAAYAAKLDEQVISGNGTAPNHRGILNVSGINSVTYTDTTPTVAEAYPKIADALQRIATNRFLPAEVIVMHPRRWAWFLAALDSQNRPLVVPQGGAFNQVAAAGDVAASGRVGTLLGLPVYTDPLVPTNLGTGTNEDVIILAKVSDMRLWEGALRTRVLQEVGSGTLTVRLQVYAYSAFMAGRYPSGIATVGGTGLVTPTF